MCAMIPMLRTRSGGTLSLSPVALEGRVSRATAITTCTSYDRGSLRSPLVVREGLVGLGHLVGLFLATDRRAGVVQRVEQLALELVGHRLAGALARGLDDPAHRERVAAVGPDLGGPLVGS